MTTGRSPHGERGLKSVCSAQLVLLACRSPHGERGLKYCHYIVLCPICQSLSSWRAWIEICFSGESVL